MARSEFRKTLAKGCLPGRIIVTVAHARRTFQRPGRRWLLGLNLLLLLATAAAVGVGQVGDRGTPGVEDTVARYAAAVRAQDLPAALAELAPASRERWREWLAGQLGNIYEVKGIGVRYPSALDVLSRGRAWLPREVTVVLDVNRGYPDLFYQPTARVGIVAEDGRYYLEDPLLAPTEEPHPS